MVGYGVDYNVDIVILSNNGAKRKGEKGVVNACDDSLMMTAGGNLPAE